MIDCLMRGGTSPVTGCFAPSFLSEHSKGIRTKAQRHEANKTQLEPLRFVFTCVFQLYRLIASNGPTRFPPLHPRVAAPHTQWVVARAAARFHFALARGAAVRQAASRLGFGRQSAYMLRRKSGADSFAAAWDRAIDFARDARVANRHSYGLGGGIESLLIPRFHAGRLIGFVQRLDYRGALRTLR